MANIQRIGVVGAGIAGLTCAYELQKAGFDVTIFEKNDYVGGRMATRSQGDLPFDIGANHLINLYYQIKTYCQEFGIEWQKMEFMNYGLFRNGKIIPLEKALGKIGSIRLFLQLPKKRELLDFFNFGETLKYDTDNTYDGMVKKIGQEAMDYFVDPGVSTYQFHRADELSLGVFKTAFESMYHDKILWNLFHMKGGMSALPEAFAKRLKNLKKGTAVQSVSVLKNGEIEIEYSPNVGAGTKGVLSKEKFDAVVMASTANATLQTLSSPTKAQKTLLEKIEYSTTISVAFEIPSDLLANHSIVWVPYVQNKFISSYTNEAWKGTEAIHQGKTLVSIWLHQGFAKEIIEKNNDEIFDLVKKHFLNVCPPIKDSSLLKNYDLQKWPQAMPKFSHGHITLVEEFLKTGQGENNIFFCGDYLNNVWTEGSVRCAQRVAKEIGGKKSPSSMI